MAHHAKCAKTPLTVIYVTASILQPLDINCIYWKGKWPENMQLLSKKCETATNNWNGYRSLVQNSISSLGYWLDLWVTSDALA